MSLRGAFGRAALVVVFIGLCGTVASLSFGTRTHTTADASGSPIRALHGGGLLDQPLTSSELESYGEAGPGGRWITVYANATHGSPGCAGTRSATRAARVRAGT